MIDVYFAKRFEVVWGPEVVVCVWVADFFVTSICKRNICILFCGVKTNQGRVCAGLETHRSITFEEPIIMLRQNKAYLFSLKQMEKSSIGR